MEEDTGERWWMNEGKTQRSVVILMTTDSEVKCSKSPDADEQRRKRMHSLTPGHLTQTSITGMCEETGETRYKMKPRLNCLLVCDVVSWGCYCECVHDGFLATSQTQLWQTHLSNAAVGFFCKCASARSEANTRCPSLWRLRAHSFVPNDLVCKYATSNTDTRAMND